MAWLRIASAALVFAAWRRPWRTLARLDRAGRILVAEWGLTLATMNCCFYEAISRLPLSTVAAIEFLPVVGLAALGARTPRNVTALAMAVTGAYVLTGVELRGHPLGLVFAFANAALFAVYIVLAHRTARHPAFGGDGGGAGSGIDGLAAAMLIAAVIVTPIAGGDVVKPLTDPIALLAGVGVGISSSVIPYVTDQLAMARLERSTYSLMVALLPATAAIVGAIVLAQIPTPSQIAGIILVVAGIAVHAEKDQAGTPVHAEKDERAGKLHSAPREEYRRA